MSATDNRARSRNHPGARPTLVRLQEHEREKLSARAIELRLAGRSYREAARELGCSHANVIALVREAIESTSAALDESATELRALELERLDELHQALWPAATGGDVQAVDRVLRISERRSRLLGLDLQRADIHASLSLVDATSLEARQAATNRLDAMVDELDRLRQLEAGTVEEVVEVEEP